MSWFNNLKVGRKVLIASLLFLLIITGVSILSIYSVRDAQESFHIFYSDRFIPVRQLNGIMRNLLQIRANMLQEEMNAREGNWDGVKERMNNSKELAQEYLKLWEDYRATSMTKEEAALAEEWEKQGVGPREARVKFAQELLAGNFIESEKYLEEWLVGYNALKDTTDKLIALQQKEGEALYEHEKASANQVFIISFIILVVSIIFGIVITFVLSRAVSRPVNMGLAFARKISEGDLTERINLDQDDELGQLGKALNKAAENLESLVTNVIFASQNLVQAVEQISTGNQNLSQRTSEQASSLEEIASTIEQATAAINQNADNAEEARDVAGKSSNLAVKGGELVDDAVKSINEINQTSKKIGDIISVINEIAFQTNLLALNAAVEAARAGEQGRGFAVVAGEVRNLAQRSGNAAKEIGELIKNSLEMIENGTYKVNESGASLQEIIESIKNVTRVVAEIAESSREQKSGINQINTAVSEMDTMTQQNAALVEETASASEEMSNQARELLEMVQEFKISRDTTMQTNDFSKKNKLIHTYAVKDTHKITAPQKEIHEGSGSTIKHDDVKMKNVRDDVSSVLEHEGFEQF